MDNTLVMDRHDNRAATRAGTSDTPLVRPDDTPSVSARRSLLQRTLDGSAYLLMGFPVAVVVFAVSVALLSAGLGLMITLVGLPLLVGLAWWLRGTAGWERMTIRRQLHLAAPTPRYRTSEPHQGWVRRQLRVITDPQTYLDLAWSLLHFPITVIGFSVTVAWWGSTLGGLSYVLWGWTVPRGPDNETVASLIGLGHSRAADVLLITAVGFVALVTLPFVIWGMTLLQSGLSRALLSGRAFLEDELADATSSRDAARSAETSQLNRIERDIHDGPQQRLVRLKVDLARAKRQLGETTPDHPTIVQLEAAMTATQETLDELRGLSRGIAPQVLTRDGLHRAALESADRCPVPTTAHSSILDGPGVFAPHLERTAYFVIAEALTNVAKHSHATQARVHLDQVDSETGPMLQVVVVDDGIGGAETGLGHGLVGLTERVRGAGGALDLSSPAGGPTELTVVLPLA